MIHQFLKLLHNQRGDGMVDKIIGLFVAAIVVSAVIGGAITAIRQTSQTSWETSDIAMWGVVATFILLGVVYTTWQGVRG